MNTVITNILQPLEPPVQRPVALRVRSFTTRVAAHLLLAVLAAKLPLANSSGSPVIQAWVHSSRQTNSIAGLVQLGRVAVDGWATSL